MPEKKYPIKQMFYMRREKDHNKVRIGLVRLIYHQLKPGGRDFKCLALPLVCSATINSGWIRLGKKELGLVNMWSRKESVFSHLKYLLNLMGSRLKCLLIPKPDFLHSLCTSTSGPYSHLLRLLTGSKAKAFDHIKEDYRCTASIESSWFDFFCLCVFMSIY